MMVDELQEKVLVVVGRVLLIKEKYISMEFYEINLLVAGGLVAGGAVVLVGTTRGTGAARIPEEPPAPGPVALVPLPNGLNNK